MLSISKNRLERTALPPSIFLVRPENAYLNQERAQWLPPFDVAEQQSWWRNKAPSKGNLVDSLNDDFSIEVGVYQKSRILFKSAKSWSNGDFRIMARRNVLCK